MLIEEHIKGTISIPVHDGDSYTVIEHEFSEEDTIQGSCSITSRCCDDQTFSIGGVRPAELAIKLRLEIPDVNAYTLYGAKIRLWSKYSSPDDESKPWILRGEFWVTSVSRAKTIYTLRASDALVWLDSGSYAASSYGSSKNEKDNPIYMKCSGAVYTIDAHFNLNIIPYVNEQLAYCDIDAINCAVSADVTNNHPDVQDKSKKYGYVLIPADISGSCGSRSPRDYAAYFAQISAGCIQMLTDPDAPEVCRLYLTPYFYEPSTDFHSEKFISAWKEPVSIPYESIELDSCDIADYTLYIQCTYVKTYDGTGWSCSSPYNKYLGNVTIDMSGNPFIDGRLYHDNEKAWPYAILMNAGEQLGKGEKRPFSLKCHVPFSKLTDYPKLGQAVRIEEKPGIWKNSIITKMVWRFRGGWEFGCAGSDSRVLSQAAKRSLAKHAEESAKTYANMVANAAGASISEVKDTADAAMAQANQTVYDLQNTINVYDSNFQDVWNRLAALENK